MAQTSPLATLIELAEKQTDEAAAKLGKAIHHSEELEQKLLLLKQYRDDYSTKMQTEMQSGKGMQQIRKFLLFLSKIDDAITGQHQLVIDGNRRVQIEQQHWQEQERKRLSYNTLEVRAEKVLQKKELMRDQKQNDEHSNRQAFYKR